MAFPVQVHNKLQITCMLSWDTHTHTHTHGRNSCCWLCALASSDLQTQPTNTVLHLYSFWFILAHTTLCPLAKFHWKPQANTVWSLPTHLKEDYPCFSYPSSSAGREGEILCKESAVYKSSLKRLKKSWAADSCTFHVLFSDVFARITTD